MEIAIRLIRFGNSIKANPVQMCKQCPWEKHWCIRFSWDTTAPFANTALDVNDRNKEKPFVSSDRKLYHVYHYQVYSCCVFEREKNTSLIHWDWTVYFITQARYQLLYVWGGFFFFFQSVNFSLVEGSANKMKYKKTFFAKTCVWRIKRE